MTIHKGVCKVNKVFFGLKGLSCMNGITLCWDSKYTKDVYGVSKAFLDRKGVIALVEDTIGNALVLIRMKSKVFPLHKKGKC